MHRHYDTLSSLYDIVVACVLDEGALDSAIETHTAYNCSVSVVCVSACLLSIRRTCILLLNILMLLFMRKTWLVPSRDLKDRVRSECKLWYYAQEPGDSSFSWWTCRRFNTLRAISKIKTLNFIRNELRWRWGLILNYFHRTTLERRVRVFEKCGMILLLYYVIDYNMIHQGSKKHSSINLTIEIESLDCRTNWTFKLHKPYTPPTWRLNCICFKTIPLAAIYYTTTNSLLL